MSCAMRIRKGSSWCPQCWVFDSILEKVAALVEAQDFRLAERVRDGTTERHAFGYLDLSDWTSEEMRLFLAAAINARSRCERVGPASWYDPKTFPGYMQLFAELIETLRKDERLRAP